MQKNNRKNWIYNYQTIKDALVKLDNIAEGESKTLFVINIVRRKAHKPSLINGHARAKLSPNHHL